MASFVAYTTAAEQGRVTFLDVRGAEAAKGTCHKCGGGLTRGNRELARLCGRCGTRFHASDCGARLVVSGYSGPTDVCPKCNGLCACVDGPCVCHASTVRKVRALKASGVETEKIKALTTRLATTTTVVEKNNNKTEAGAEPKVGCSDGAVSGEQADENPPRSSSSRRLHPLLQNHHPCEAQTLSGAGSESSGKRGRRESSPNLSSCRESEAEWHGGDTFHAAGGGDASRAPRESDGYAAWVMRAICATGHPPRLSDEGSGGVSGDVPASGSDDAVRSGGEDNDAGSDRDLVHSCHLAGTPPSYRVDARGFVALAVDVNVDVAADADDDVDVAADVTFVSPRVSLQYESGGAFKMSVDGRGDTRAEIEDGERHFNPELVSYITQMVSLLKSEGEGSQHGVDAVVYDAMTHDDVLNVVGSADHGSNGRFSRESGGGDGMDDVGERVGRGDLTTTVDDDGLSLDELTDAEKMLLAVMRENEELKRRVKQLNSRMMDAPLQQQHAFGCGGGHYGGDSFMGGGDEMMACFPQPSPVPEAHLPSHTGFLTAASTRGSYEGDHHPLPNFTSASASASASAVSNARTGLAEMSDLFANEMFADHPEMAMTFLMRSQAEDACRHRGKRARLEDAAAHGTSVCEKTNRRSAFYRGVRTISRTLALFITTALLIWSTVRMHSSTRTNLCPAMSVEVAADDSPPFTSASQVSPAAKSASATTSTTAGAGDDVPSPAGELGNLSAGNLSAGNLSAGNFSTYVDLIEANRRGYLSYEQAISLSGAVHPDSLRAIQEIMRYFEVVKSNDAIDGAYSAWNTMMELTCQKYAAEFTLQASSEAVTRYSNENRAQLELMMSKYDALLMYVESHNSLFVYPVNTTAVRTERNDLWSVPQMFAEVMRIGEWDLPCSFKTNLVLFFWFAFIAMWHVLTLEAWLGLRYWRARLWMWRWELNNRRKTANSVADAKAFALAPHAPHSGFSDDEVDNPPVYVSIDHQ